MKRNEYIDFIDIYHGQGSYEVWYPPMYVNSLDIKPFNTPLNMKSFKEKVTNEKNELMGS